MKVTESQERLGLLKELLEQGKISTQEDIVNELKGHKFKVTQSTISRDLRRLGAIKTVENSGRTVYRLSEDFSPPPSPINSDLKGLLTEVSHNGVLIVLHTPPGSASLIAHHLDQTKPDGILGTIAGDDTIFVAPISTKKIPETIEAILNSF